MRNERLLLLATTLASFALSGCSGNRTDELVQQLEDPDPQLRRAAIRALEDDGGDVAVIVPALEQTLDDSDSAVRLSAAITIEHLDPANTAIRPVIVESLTAAHAPLFLEVGRMGHDAAWAVPTLVRLLAHPQAQIRALSARALGEIGVANDECDTALESRRRDEAAVVRQAAESALERIRSNADSNEG